MLTREGRKQIVLLLALSVALFGAASAQIGAERVPVSRELVANAMHAAGFEINPAQIEFLSSVNALLGMHLSFVGVTKESAGASVVKLRCDDSRQCLPFYVLAHELNAHRDALKLPEVTLKPRDAKTISKAKLLVNRGQPVSLIIERADLRIVISGVCLEGGTLGETIRVASPDRKRIYRGEVVNENTVKSTL
jgi:hypothetical protein